MPRAALTLAVAACAPSLPADPAPPRDTGEAPVVSGGDFAFVVLADPHLTGEGDRADRLRDAVAWIEAERDARGIELVLVAGDVAWGDGLPLVRGILDGLAIPWVPMIGDNEIQVGDEAAYHTTVSPHLDALGATLPGWIRQSGPVFLPEPGADAWLQGFGFTWRGVTFVGLDVAARVIDPLWGEFAYLHDVDGGSLPFLAERLDALAPGPREDVVVLTHNPLLWTAGGFDPVQQARLLEVVDPFADRVALALGGHLHLDAEWLATDEVPYDVVLTDAVWDDTNRARVVEVTLDGATFRYTHASVEIPPRPAE